MIWEVQEEFQIKKKVHPIQSGHFGHRHRSFLAASRSAQFLSTVGQLWSVQTAYFQLLLLPCFNSRSQHIKVINSSLVFLLRPRLLLAITQYPSSATSISISGQSQFPQGRLHGRQYSDSDIQRSHPARSSDIPNPTI